MKKVVINRCYGGFGLSPRAIKKLIEIESPIIDKTPIKKYDNTWFSKFDNDEIVSLGKYKYIRFITSFLFDEKYVYTLYSISEFEKLREHPDLIKVIEELGEKANSESSELRIVEIPDGVDYEIDDYDGIESIHEKHRVWC